MAASFCAQLAAICRLGRGPSQAAGAGAGAGAAAATPPSPSPRKPPKPRKRPKKPYSDCGSNDSEGSPPRLSTRLKKFLLPTPSLTGTGASRTDSSEPTLSEQRRLDEKKRTKDKEQQRTPPRRLTPRPLTPDSDDGVSSNSNSRSKSPSPARTEPGRVIIRPSPLHTPSLTPSPEPCRRSVAPSPPAHDEAWVGAKTPEPDNDSEEEREVEASILGGADDGSVEDDDAESIEPGDTAENVEPGDTAENPLDVDDASSEGSMDSRLPLSVSPTFHSPPPGWRSPSPVREPTPELDLPQHICFPPPPLYACRQDRWMEAMANDMDKFRAYLEADVYFVLREANIMLGETKVAEADWHEETESYHDFMQKIRRVSGKEVVIDLLNSVEEEMGDKLSISTSESDTDSDCESVASKLEAATEKDHAQVNVYPVDTSGEEASVADSRLATVGSVHKTGNFRKDKHKPTSPRKPVEDRVGKEFEAIINHAVESFAIPPAVKKSTKTTKKRSKRPENQYESLHPYHRPSSAPSARDRSRSVQVHDVQSSRPLPEDRRAPYSPAGHSPSSDYVSPSPIRETLSSLPVPESRRAAPAPAGRSPSLEYVSPSPIRETLSSLPVPNSRLAPSPPPVRVSANRQSRHSRTRIVEDHGLSARPAPHPYLARPRPSSSATRKLLDKVARKLEALPPRSEAVIESTDAKVSGQQAKKARSPSLEYASPKPEVSKPRRRKVTIEDVNTPPPPPRPRNKELSPLLEYIGDQMNEVPNQSAQKPATEPEVANLPKPKRTVTIEDVTTPPPPPRPRNKELSPLLEYVGDAATRQSLEIPTQPATTKKPRSPSLEYVDVPPAVRQSAKTSQKRTGKGKEKEKDMYMRSHPYRRPESRAKASQRVAVLAEEPKHTPRFSRDDDPKRAARAEARRTLMATHRLEPAPGVAKSQRATAEDTPWDPAANLPTDHHRGVNPFASAFGGGGGNPAADYAEFSDDSPLSGLFAEKPSAPVSGPSKSKFSRPSRPKENSWDPFPEPPPPPNPYDALINPNPFRPMPLHHPDPYANIRALPDPYAEYKTSHKYAPHLPKHLPRPRHHWYMPAGCFMPREDVMSGKVGPKRGREDLYGLDRLAKKARLAKKLVKDEPVEETLPAPLTEEALKQVSQSSAKQLSMSAVSRLAVTGHEWYREIAPLPRASPAAVARSATQKTAPVITSVDDDEDERTSQASSTGAVLRGVAESPARTIYNTVPRRWQGRAAAAGEYPVEHITPKPARLTNVSAGRDRARPPSKRVDHETIDLTSPSPVHPAVVAGWPDSSALRALVNSDTIDPPSPTPSPLWTAISAPRPALPKRPRREIAANLYEGSKAKSPLEAAVTVENIDNASRASSTGAVLVDESEGPLKKASAVDIYASEGPSKRASVDIYASEGPSKSAAVDIYASERPSRSSSVDIYATARLASPAQAVIDTGRTISPFKKALTVDSVDNASPAPSGESVVGSARTKSPSKPVVPEVIDVDARASAAPSTTVVARDAAIRLLHKGASKSSTKAVADSGGASSPLKEPTAVESTDGTSPRPSATDAAGIDKPKMAEHPKETDSLPTMVDNSASPSPAPLTRATRATTRAATERSKKAAAVPAAARAKRSVVGDNKVGPALSTRAAAARGRSKKAVLVAGNDSASPEAVVPEPPRATPSRSTKAAADTGRKKTSAPKAKEAVTGKRKAKTSPPPKKAITAKRKAKTPPPPVTGTGMTLRPRVKAG
ncbi:hypothetical protein OE88DRAFT_1737241 [Heliocybe sulcata]|uniref:Uncharacterized protein n=1 Tax=Heliocybe sulcata TaxID=5364 RepID=A0A5C3MVG9_9AGAM|nr:hypothetical protein OE88DRAFT_1737241 [Heliocybe sulcata]